MLGEICVFKFLEKCFGPIPQHVYIFPTFETLAFQRRVVRGHTTSVRDSTGPQSVPGI